MWPWERRKRTQLSLSERRAEQAWARLAAPIRSWSIRRALPVVGPRRVMSWTVEDGRFVEPRETEGWLDLEGAWWFPGLVNAHEHLGFSNAPLTAPGAPYASMSAWAADAKPSARRGTLQRAMRLPLVERFWIGMLRNLLTGATTAIHHDAGHSVMGPGALIQVPAIGWTHSLPFGRDPEAEHAVTEGAPFVLHLAEGTDPASRSEYDEAVERGLIGPGTVAVHGLALSPEQLADFASRGGALVWCPSSNRALYGRTLRLDAIPDALPLLLGTDSPLSGGPLLLEEARVAVDAGLPLERLLPMLTTVPAEVFHLKSADQRVPGGVADGFAIERVTDDPIADLLDTPPEQILCVVSGGRPLVIDERLTHELEDLQAGLVFRGFRKRVRPEGIAPIRHLLVDGEDVPEAWVP